MGNTKAIHLSYRNRKRNGGHECIAQNYGIDIEYFLYVLARHAVNVKLCMYYYSPHQGSSMYSTQWFGSPPLSSLLLLSSLCLWQKHWDHAFIISFMLVPTHLCFLRHDEGIFLLLLFVYLGTALGRGA